MTQAVLFDIDGTLIDSNDLHAQAWGKIFRRYGVDLPHDRIRQQIGKGGDNLMPALLAPEILEKHGPQIEKERGELFKRAYLDRVRPFPGVPELFCALKGAGVRVALASSGSKSEVEHHVELLGVSELIEGATSADDAEHSKPCPDIFVAALARLEGVPASEAIVVGDTPYDMEAAGKIGIAGVALRCGGFSEPTLREAGAAALYDGPWDLPRNVNDWLSRRD